MLCPGSGGWILKDEDARKRSLPPVQLYDLVRDPRERTNLAQPRPEIVRQMERLLEAARATGKVGDALPPPEEMDPELRERLRSLGYLK